MMGILAGAALNAFAEKQGARWKALFGACLIATVMSPAVSIAGILWAQFRHVEALSTYYEAPVPIGRDDRDAMNWLRRRVLPDEIVYRAPKVSIGYMEFGGLPSTPSIPWRSKQFRLAERRTVAMRKLLETLPPDLAAYRAMGIVWFVVAPDDPRMERNVAKWVQDGTVVKQADFGSLRIYKVTEPSQPKEAAHDSTPVGK